MRPRSLFGALILAFLASSPVRVLGAERNFENLIPRVLWYGSSATLHEKVAHIFGFPGTKVLVNQLRFHERSETRYHVFMVTVAPFYRQLILLASIDPNDGSGTVWSVSPDGTLMTTLVFAGGAVEKVSNADFRGDFAAEKEYFFRRLPSDEIAKSLAKKRR